jgi:hypothetical protein
LLIYVDVVGVAQAVWSLHSSMEGLRCLGSLHPFQLQRCGGMNRGIYRENHQQHSYIRAKYFLYRRAGDGWVDTEGYHPPY